MIKAPVSNCDLMGALRFCGKEEDEDSPFHPKAPQARPAMRKGKVNNTYPLLAFGGTTELSALACVDFHERSVTDDAMTKDH